MQSRFLGPAIVCVGLVLLALGWMLNDREGLDPTAGRCLGASLRGMYFETVSQMKKMLGQLDKWLDAAEMIVATNFDLVYLPAQERRLVSLNRDAAELQATIKAVRHRNQKARYELPEIVTEIKEMLGAVNL